MIEAPPDGPTPHQPQLDGLRFLAFLAVFFHHAWPVNCRWGWAGVQFFFALSGFLITRILVRAESGDLGADLRRFYLRRTLRIFPLYYALVVFMASTGQIDNLGYLLTYTYNIRGYFTRSLSEVFGHFWTLSVEEQFYVLYPLILLFTPARRRIAMVLVLIASAVGFQAYAHYRMSLPSARILLPYCGEDLLWGCLAGMIELRTRPGRLEGPACFVAGFPILLLAWETHDGRLPLPAGLMEVGSVSLFGIGSALIVFGAWRSEGRWIVAPLALAPVAYLGRISYGLYVFHMPVMRGGWVEAIPYGFLIPRPWGALAMTIGLSALSWRYFEGPINRLKDRRTGRPVADGSSLVGEAREGPG
jgi:peptidoglycan/LPS O-acetylase OafA/YrhL